jgi:hypothetical protein
VVEKELALKAEAQAAGVRPYRLFAEKRRNAEAAEPDRNCCIGEHDGGHARGCLFRPKAAG